mgnify:CR=1 FL=1
MTLHWLVTSVAVAVAVLALFRARLAARRLDTLSDSYWELRYESGQLKARVNRLEAAAGQAVSEPDAGREHAHQPGPASFIPLSSLRK